MNSFPELQNDLLTECVKTLQRGAPIELHGRRCILQIKPCAKAHGEVDFFCYGPMSLSEADKDEARAWASRNIPVLCKAWLERFPRRDSHLDSIDVPSQACPKCGESIYAVSGMGFTATKGPKPGDFSICLYCGQILRFSPELQVQVAEEKDLDDLSLQQRVELNNTRRYIQSQKARA